MEGIDSKYYAKCLKWFINVIKKYRKKDTDIISIDNEGNLYMYNPEYLPEYYTMHLYFNKWKKDNKKLTIADTEEIKAVNKFIDIFKNHSVLAEDFIIIGKNLTKKNVTNISLREDNIILIELQDKPDKGSTDPINDYEFEIKLYDLVPPKYDMTNLECDNYVEFEGIPSESMVDKRLNITDELFLDIKTSNYISFDGFNLDSVFIMEETDETALIILESNYDEDNIDKSKAGNSYFDNIYCFYRIAKSRE